VQQTNVTGNVTAASVNYTNVIFDQSSSYDGLNLYTAPITGNYFFSAGVTMGGFTSTAWSNTSFILFTSNRVIRLILLQSPGKCFNASGRVGLASGAFTDMDLGDTVYMQGFAGTSTKTISFVVTGLDYFGGALIC